MLQSDVFDVVSQPEPQALGHAACVLLADVAGVLGAVQGVRQLALRLW